MQTPTPFLAIVGPTATGKTEFALTLAMQLAKEFTVVDLISADSRQVYQGMEIGSGADVPADFSRQSVNLDGMGYPYPYFANQTGMIQLHGASFLSPNQEWSVALFQQLVQNVLDVNSARKGTALLVGGTGLYLEKVFSKDAQLTIPPNPELREAASGLSLAELQSWAMKRNSAAYLQMNSSDKHNPRRLIRMIEKAEFAEKQTENTYSDTLRENRENDYDSENCENRENKVLVKIGLTDTLENIEARITARVEARLQNGMLDEVQHLMSAFSDIEWKMAAFSATGYKEVRAYLEGLLEYEEMKKLWMTRERQYAKRQLTWWKKDPDVTWFSVSDSNWQEKAINFASLSVYLHHAELFHS